MYSSSMGRYWERGCYRGGDITMESRETSLGVRVGSYHVEEEGRTVKVRVLLSVLDLAG